jgi:hypothetical protein
MSQPKYTEDPMAYLREVVAAATLNRLARLRKAAETAKSKYESAQSELNFALECAETGEFSDIDCTLHGECWTDVLRRINVLDDGKPWGDMYKRVLAHPSDREDYDLFLLAKLFPDFNPKEGQRIGLDRFKEESK